MSAQKPFNPWHYKPWWCQPWSIVLVGVLAIGGSWAIFHQLWLTLLVALPITAWWGFFLILWPSLVRASLAASPEHSLRENLPLQDSPTDEVV